MTPVCPAITVNPVSLNNGTVGTAYSQTISGIGGVSPYSFSIFSGALPAGLSLNASTGLISGIPTSTSAATFTLRALDTAGCSGTRSYTVTPLCPTITITPSTLTVGIVGSVYSEMLTAAGGSVPYSTWTITSGTLPTGLSLNASTGEISGIPTVVVSPAAPITVRVNDIYGCQGTQVINVQVCPVVTLNPVSLSVATVGTAYSQTVSATGGSGSYVFALSSGTLPSWATLNASSGAITGMPNSTTSASFTIRATDTNGCAGTRAYTVAPVGPIISITPVTLPDSYFGSPYSQTLTASGGTLLYTWSVSAGSLPAGLSLNSSGVISGTPTGSGGGTFTVRATDTFGCQATQAYTMNGRGLSIGNLVFVDMNNDGIRQNTESGVPGLAVQLWSPGANGLRDNGASDDVQVGATSFTDSNGAYQFINLAATVYYVRIQTPPTFFPSVSSVVVTTDNGVNNDSNGAQPGGSGTQVVSPLITLTPGGEPASGVDGDDTDRESTIDFGFANTDPCYTNNLIDNPSFEFDGTANATGVAFTAMSYNGAGTSFGATNALSWLGGSNGSSGVGEPIQRVQVLAGNAGARVSWVESLKARHGRRYMLVQGTNSCVSLRAAGGGAWSSRLTAGKEYELSVWAANASAASANVIWDIAHVSGQVLQVISGPTPGSYQYYQVPQTEMTGTPSPFASANYNSWTEATVNATQPNWSRYTWRFRVMPTATTTQIDGLSLLLSGGPSTNPMVLDYVALCEVVPTNTMAIGSLVWNDLNRNGIKDAAESGVSGVTVDLYTSTNLIAGDGDDVLVATTTTSGSGIYSFANRAAGNYVVRVTPTVGLPLTGGSPVALDNNIDNDNNGSQPGGSGTVLLSPVITLATGTESIIDGDTNPDTELTVDFGLWSGFSVGNLVWNDLNNDGLYQSASESGIGSVSVQLLNSGGTVVQTTTTNASGLYGFTVTTPGVYSVRI
ncbi:MAG: putative Ig domain-containing protein, partial [Verrucomicrobia bacterium]|nr:putative Ig domain-containing protein [Verrucomicrobiota bacterium]